MHLVYRGWKRVGEDHVSRKINWYFHNTLEIKKGFNVSLK